MPYPGLVHEDHTILGSEYCSGYTDIYGKWNTGFYCPQTGSTSAVSCCGTSYFKYCCTTKPTLDEDEEIQDQTSSISPYTVRVPIVFAIFCGVLAVVLLLVTAICFFCSCCVVYKKRRDAASSLGLYRIQGSSSTVSALASIYSNQNNSSVVTTPLDPSDWSHIPYSARSSYIPYPFSPSQSQQSQSPNPNPTPLLTSSAYPSSLTIPTTHGSNFSLNHNNNIPAFYYNNLNSNNNHNISSLSNLYQYQRPMSALSTLSSNSSQSNSTVPTFPLRYQQQQSSNGNPNPNPTLTNSSGYSTTNSSRSQSLRPGSGPGSGCMYTYDFRQLSGQAQNSVNLIGQTQTQRLNSFRRDPANSGPNPNFSSPNSQQQTCFINQNNNQNIARHLLQQYQRSGPGATTGLPYDNNIPRASSGCGTGGNSGGGGRPRTQGNYLSQQQQERLATVQNLISAYRGSGSGRLASLTTSDVNRLNAINLLVSAVLNQNRRTPCPGNSGGGDCNNSAKHDHNTNTNSNGVIRGPDGESLTTSTANTGADSNSTSATTSTTNRLTLNTTEDANLSETVVESVGVSDQSLNFQNENQSESGPAGDMNATPTNDERTEKPNSDQIIETIETIASVPLTSVSDCSSDGNIKSDSNSKLEEELQEIRESTIDHHSCVQDYQDDGKEIDGEKTEKNKLVSETAIIIEEFFKSCGPQKQAEVTSSCANKFESKEVEDVGQSDVIQKHVIQSHNVDSQITK